MTVRFTAKAEADLESIGDYIARDDPNRALTFLAELREQSAALSDFPERFPLVPRYERFGIRRRLHGKYLIFHRVEVETITILHVLQGAQDYEAILFPN